MVKEGHKPELIIISGPNGSGKTSVTRRFLHHEWAIGTERAKIACAEKLFNSISTANVKYHKVASYEDLRNAIHAVG